MAGKYLYSARGDDGKTGLIGPGRFSKSELRFEVLGTIDEASAQIGLAKSCLEKVEWKELLTQVQRDLYLMMGEISTHPSKAQQPVYIQEDKIIWLQEQIQALAETTVLPEGFIIPGDSTDEATLDVARTVVRRAERRLVEIIDQDEYRNFSARRYLNRLSSLLFQLEICVHQSKNLGPVTMAKEKTN